MIRLEHSIPLLFLVGLGACSDASPTSPKAELDEAALELVAEQALEVNNQQGTPLPSLNHLLRLTFKAIKENPAQHQEGARLLRAGHTLQGIIAVLGPQVAAESLKGVSQALERLRERFQGRTLPDRMTKILREAHQHARRGKEAWDAGRYAAALGAALTSADLIRSLSPRYQARKAIERAEDLYRAALEVITVDPTDEEEAALKKARRYLRSAIEAFQAKEYRKAWRHARESASLSLAVLKDRSST